MKIGKAILPIMENAFDMYSSAPLPFSMGVISALFVWSMSIEINAMYFSLAPLRIWQGLSGFVLCVEVVVWGAACCGTIVLVFIVAFGGMMDPLVIKTVYLFIGVQEWYPQRDYSTKTFPFNGRFYSLNPVFRKYAIYHRRFDFPILLN